MINENNAIKYLIICLKFLKLLPTSGNGNIELVIRDNVLIDTIKTERIRIKENL